VVISLGQLQAQDFASGPGEVGGPGVMVPVTVTGVAQTNTGAMLELDHAKPVSPAEARLII